MEVVKVKPVGFAVLVALALILLLAVPPLAHAGGHDDGAPATSFTYEGTGCVESIVQFGGVAIDRVRPFVPDRFQILDFGGGTTVLLVPIADCEAISVDGAPATPGIFTDLGVPITSPDGTGGTHVYLLWQVESHRALHARMRSVGVAGALDPRAQHSVEQAGEQTRGLGVFRWPRVPFSLETFTGEYSEQPDSGNVWWHLGGQGLVRISYAFTNVAVAFGEGSVHAPVGSQIAEMLDATSAAGFGVSVLLDLTGIVELVERR